MYKYKFPNIKDEAIPTITLDLEQEEVNKEVYKGNEQEYSVLRPRLVCKVTALRDHIVLSRDGLDFCVEVNGLSVETLHSLLLKMDGTRSISELQQLVSPVDAVCIISRLYGTTTRPRLAYCDEFRQFNQQRYLCH
ncbi:hypothetical protein LC653_00240 [Nostoc sp. CHAB 5784]|uniref:hypothetical protein n=1 Tax=Nostoc mirabile TaxID=2907820 RepID=UPI001E4BF36C|nr:hypothetical protein [Nostoc mirabile]MCC5662404.1 hypothetical protein [Nostoc mirabile CHAB5784]